MEKAGKIMIVAAPVGSTVQKIDAIEYAGHVWLVPVWVDATDGKSKLPARLICLTLLAHQKSQGQVWDYLVQEPLPAALFDYDAPLPAETRFLVIDPLRLRFPIVRAAN